MSEISWENGTVGSLLAKSGQLTIGHIVSHDDQSVTWSITAVNMRYIAQDGGNSPTLLEAMSKLTSAWNKWLEFADLTMR